MSDITEVEAAGITKITGSEADGTEQTPVQSTPTGDLKTGDFLDNGGLDKILTVVAGVPEELKVGGTVKANRKYVIMESKDTGVTWGFSNSTQSFDLFKSQLIMVPVGPNTQIWFASSAGSKSVAIAEIS